MMPLHHLLALSLLLLGSFVTQCVSSEVELCPDGSDAIEGYFAYEIQLLDFKTDCGTEELMKIDYMMDGIVRQVEENYPDYTGGDEIFLRNCGSATLSATGKTRRLRVLLGVDSIMPDSFHRKLGIYTRSGGGYCRRCGGGRRNLQTLAGEKEALSTELTKLEQTEAELETVQATLLTRREFKNLEAWLKGFEDTVAKSLAVGLTKYVTFCNLKFSQVVVDIQLLNDASELPC